jgi:hypothetical protein
MKCQIGGRSNEGKGSTSVLGTGSIAVFEVEGKTIPHLLIGSLLFADILMKTEVTLLFLVSFDERYEYDITNRFNNRAIPRRQPSVTQIRFDRMRY